MVRLWMVITLACASFAIARKPTLEERGIPKKPTGVRTITSKQGAKIRFKQPGKDGRICETTPGVDDYAGYISLNETYNMFFWFIEARHNPSEKPLTVWLNGGPGSDSLIGLFQEHGPCSVTKDLKTKLNPYSWNEESNMLYLSQPIGTGFSYETTMTDDSGRYALVDPHTTDTTRVAAVGAWHILQTFLELSPKLDPDIKNFTFNLWAQSFGGHYGPGFFKYFWEQNEDIKNGSVRGIRLQMDTLGIISGGIDYEIQVPYFPEFAVNNINGIKAVDDFTYKFMKTAWSIPGGCRTQIQWCKDTIQSSGYFSEDAHFYCSQASIVCRTYVEYPYAPTGERQFYDIRNNSLPPNDFVDFLNMASTQQALGVNLNYTNWNKNNGDVGYGFSTTGDFIYSFLGDLQALLDYGVRVALIYGDADYTCNWFGGEAVSLAANHSDADNFRAAKYAPFVVDGVEYGKVREHRNFSFTRVYEAGHMVPYYQPKAMLELFRRVLNHRPIKGECKAATGANGKCKAKHTQGTGKTKNANGKGKAKQINGKTKAKQTKAFVAPPSTSSSKGIAR